MNISSKVPARSGEPSSLVRVILFFAAITFAIVTITGLTGLLIYNSFKAPRHESKAIANSVGIKTFVVLQSDNSFPYGLAAAPDGTLYLTQFGTGELSKVGADGALTPVALSGGKLTAAGSIAVAADKSLYVIDYSSSNPGKAEGSIRLISPDGKIAPFGITPSGTSLPIFSTLALDKTGSLYVSDPSSGQVWKFASNGVGQIWWTLPVVGTINGVPTGIVYDAANQALIVGDTGTGTLYRVHINSQGAPGDTQVLYRATGSDVRALTMDDQGRVLFVSWEHDNGKLSRLDANDSVTVLADGFRAPTALVYQNNKVYVVNSDLTGIVPPIMGFIPSPLRARPPFTVDVVSING